MSNSGKFDPNISGAVFGGQVKYICRFCKKPIEYTDGKAYRGYVHENGHHICADGKNTALPYWGDQSEMLNKVDRWYEWRGGCFNEDR